MPTTSHTHSYYAASANDKTARPTLQEHVTADICIIGAGFTGMSTALHMAEKGYKVVVLEGSRIGFGASGRNGGQIVNSYSRDIDFIERHYGEKVGAEMGQMAFEGGRIIRRFVQQYGIQCDLKDGGLFAACNSKQFDELVGKQKLWESHGHKQLELLDRQAIQQYVGSERYTGGLLDHSGGHFHPLNLVLGEAAAVESLGGVIYENSPALRIREGDKAVVHTEEGCVEADYVLVAGNAYLNGLLPKLESKAMPCGTQVITTEPLLEEVQRRLLPKDNCVEDCNYLLDYFRLSGDGRLIYGGGVTYGAREPEKVESLIVPKMLKTFPELKGVKIDYAWTGNFLLTLMRLPQFGRIGSNVYYAQGYSGHGITCTHLAGKVISDAIQGQAERFDIFSNLPQYPFPGGRMFRIPLTAMGAWYYNLRDQLGI
ncbi:FAD-binding oxidoreductase [Marinobacter nanhaiticus D15-8W]|uniref:FAD-binding oxidoreductase n=1 Tax=Marinobacter nanhaiticus D15-8W TaxID=626887 RepID=N6W1K0_9GAMM|nr:FAD-binding oxidoreductase [Marinobacter nanhaiticus]ENO13984.1 FAD-binding oxidoreductase [Marinobacter nanhaiticus D15-8W]BES71362.1 FAD-binding oxidoreductase [Marinobacter nanhaiticus D15-8W]